MSMRQREGSKRMWETERRAVMRKSERTGKGSGGGGRRRGGEGPVGAKVKWWEEG